MRSLLFFFGDGGLGYGRESGKERAHHDDIIIVDLDDGGGVGGGVTSGGLDLFAVVSSYALATVSHRSGALTKIVLFPTLFKKQRLAPAGAYASFCVLAGSPR